MVELFINDELMYIVNDLRHFVRDNRTHSIR